MGCREGEGREVKIAAGPPPPQQHGGAGLLPGPSAERGPRSGSGRETPRGPGQQRTPRLSQGPEPPPQQQRAQLCPNAQRCPRQRRPPPRGCPGGGSRGTAGLRGSARAAEAPPGWARQRETPDTELGDPRSPAAPEPSTASPGWSSRAPRTALISARLRTPSLRRRLPVFPFVHTTIDSGF